MMLWVLTELLVLRNVFVFFLVQTLHLILTRSFHTREPPSSHTRGLPTDI